MSLIDQVLASPAFERTRDFWRRYKVNRIGVVGLILLVFFVGIAFSAPYIAPHDPWKMSNNIFLPPLKEGNWILGTDDLGRDILSGIVHGIRTSLFVGASAVACSAVIGILVGSIAGYFGGKVDDLFMRVTEFFQVIPRFFLAIVLVAFLGPSIWNLVTVIAVVTWPVTARLTRAEFLTLKERDFVMAARALGDYERTIIFREILPNGISPVIVNSSLEVATVILLEAALSFLGFGDPTMMSLGYMIYNSQRFLRLAWWMAFFPGLVMSLVILSTNMVGDALNEAMNPRLRERSI